MKKFNKLYQIIKEAVFKDEKWKHYGDFKGIEIYVSFQHIKDRLDERYKEQILNGFVFSRFIYQLVNYILKYDLFNRAIKYDQRGFNFYNKAEDFRMCGVLQKDNIDKINRIYISSVLDKDSDYFNKFDIKIQI